METPTSTGGRPPAWPHVIAASGIAAALALVTALGIAGLGDTDPYRHLAYAHQLLESRFSLRGHPFLPFTTLGDSGVDLWWGFHLLLLPFTPLGVLWGARIAGAAIAASLAGGFAWMLARFGHRLAWAFAIAPIVLSAGFAYRDHLARPAHLTVLLLLVALFAGTGTLPAGLAAAGSFVHALIHLSSPLSPIMAGIGWLGGRVRNASDGPPPGFRPVLWSVAGLGLGLLVRPDRAEYPAVAWGTSLFALGGSSWGRVRDAAGELRSPPALFYVEEILPAAALLGVALFLSRGRARPGAAGVRNASLLAAVPLTVLWLVSFRFVDYLVPVLVIAAALSWPGELPGKLIVRRTAAVLIALAAFVLTGWHVADGWKAGNVFIDPPSTFDRMAESVRAHSQPGAMLFTEDPFLTSVLYASLPDYQYVVAYEPTLLLAANPRRFWLWRHAIDEGTECDAPRCGDPSAAPDKLASAIHSFGANWVITAEAPTRSSLSKWMKQSSDQFELVATSPGPASGLALWKVAGR